MLYRVFTNQTEVDEANSRWIGASSTLHNDDITKKWDDGRIMKDGKIACIIPPSFATEFGGSEEELDESIFVEESI